MCKIKIAFSEHEDEIMDENEITGDTDVLSLFSNDFMNQHTNYNNLGDFISASGQDFCSQESWDKIQSGAIDAFISANSDFESWVDMYSTAGNEFLQKHLT